MAGGTHYNGYNKTSFYLTDFNSVESMLESAVLSIISKYNNNISLFYKRIQLRTCWNW